MSSPTELKIPFSPAGVSTPCFTYTKIFGSLPSPLPPLIVVHGGPGMCHDYLLPLSSLASSSRTVVFYDQLGGGRSSHLPERRGDAGFWTEELFIAEFENLVGHLGVEVYDVLGQSWGGMLMGRFAARRPGGLRRLVIANSPASMELWIKAANALRATLPQDVQDTLTKHEEAGTTESAEYQGAVLAFYALYVCRVRPMPAEVGTCFTFLEQDPTVYYTMNGPSEFTITGSLKSWSMLEDAHKIAVPTLLINGFYDEARDETVQPWFERIPHVRWVTFPNSSHMPHFEERERYMQVVGAFLEGEETVG